MTTKEIQKSAQRDQTRGPGQSAPRQPQGALQFEAITPGLGFHPFSDGLPYAPVSKNSATASRPPAPALPAGLSGNASGPSAHLGSGAGAMAAGPATFPLSQPSRPLPPRTGQLPRVSVPVATPTIPSPTTPRAKAPTVTSSLNIQLQPLPLETPAAATAFPVPQPGLLYLFKRVFAYLIDTALNTALLGAGLSVALWNQDLNPEILTNPGVIVISIGFFTLFNWALVTAQEIAFGTSVGKRIFRLALNGSASAIFLRAFFFLPSICFCGIGLLWSLVDPQRRCWHDLVVNVQPQEIAQL